MPREMRWRTAEILFYLILVLSLTMTQVGQDFIHNLFFSPVKADIYQVVLTILGTGLVLFSSDAIGFMFSTMVLFFWEGRFRPGMGGYSSEWLRRASYNIKDIIVEQYKNAPKKAEIDSSHKKFERQWETYNPDVFLTFIWQFAPSYIDDWDTRKYSAFFTDLSTITGMLFGLVLSALIIGFGHMGFTLTHLIILFVSLAWIYMLWRNAQYARREAWQMVDMWIAGFINPRLRKILNTLKKNNDIDPK